MKYLIFALFLAVIWGCNTNDEDAPSDVDNFVDGVLTDIDGNAYRTTKINDIIWMAENLRVTHYRDGSAIKSSYSDQAWSTTVNGVSAVYDYDQWDGEGIDSAEEMADMYGLLYNFYAVDDSRGLCPAGWHVPSKSDWQQLLTFVLTQGYSNESTSEEGAGNALKSCRQIGSPFGDDCDTSAHPRWEEPLPWGPQHFGFDAFSFSALPAGYRTKGGSYVQLGRFGNWWTSTVDEPSSAWSMDMFNEAGYVSDGPYGVHKNKGYSVRCVRYADN